MNWILFAFILGAALVLFAIWLRSKNIATKWFDWVIGLIGVVFLIVAIQHYAGSLAEEYPKAAWMGGLVFAVPGLILLGISWQLVLRRKKA